jgi:hypothetical protein
MLGIALPGRLGRLGGCWPRHGVRRRAAAGKAGWARGTSQCLARIQGWLPRIGGIAASPVLHCAVRAYRPSCVSFIEGLTRMVAKTGARSCPTVSGMRRGRALSPGCAGCTGAVAGIAAAHAGGGEGRGVEAVAREHEREGREPDGPSRPGGCLRQRPRPTAEQARKKLRGQPKPTGNVPPPRPGPGLPPDPSPWSGGSRANRDTGTGAAWPCWPAVIIIGSLPAVAEKHFPGSDRPGGCPRADCRLGRRADPSAAPVKEDLSPTHPHRPAHFSRTESAGSCHRWPPRRAGHGGGCALSLALVPNRVEGLCRCSTSR